MAVQLEDRTGTGTEELETWWTESSAGSLEARDRLIFHYAPLVKYVAARLRSGLPKSIELGDLESSGIFGLMEAIASFEPERGVPFEAYATRRIRGSMLDELRALDWAPRVVRRKEHEVERSRADLRADLRREPTDQELADWMGLSAGQLHQSLREISSMSVLMLEQQILGHGDGELTVADIVSDPDAPETSHGLESTDMRGMISEAIGRLEEREKLVVTLYYFEGLSLQEIGEVLGVSQSRACQLHTRSVRRLQRLLADA